MRSYVLKKVTSAPDWDTIDALPIDNLQWTNPPVDIRAQGQLCWDEAAIYVRLRAWETEIRAEHSGLLQSVCEDSCLEFFLRPTDDLRYFNFEFNPNCALYLGYGTNVTELTRLIVADEPALFQPKARACPMAGRSPTVCRLRLSAGFSRTLHRARGWPCTATAISAAI